MPITAATARKAALDYVPHLGEEGRALIHLLSHCDGSRTVDALARDLQAGFSGRYPTYRDALDFVQDVVRRHG
jgi:hypothetical protein